MHTGQGATRSAPNQCTWRQATLPTLRQSTLTTAGIKREAILSARSCTGAFEIALHSQALVMCATADFSPTPDSLTLMVHSPVRADSSTPEVPKSTIPAAWIFAPGGTFTRLPSKSSFVSTSRSTKLCLLFNEQSSLSSNELTETQWRHQCFPCFAFKPLTKQEKRYQHRGQVQMSNWAVSVPPTILLSHWFQMTPTLTFRICRIWLRCLTK